MIAENIKYMKYCKEDFIKNITNADVSKIMNNKIKISLFLLNPPYNSGDGGAGKKTKNKKEMRCWVVK